MLDNDDKDKTVSLYPLFSLFNCTYRTKRPILAFSCRLMRMNRCQAKISVFPSSATRSASKEWLFVRSKLQKQPGTRHCKISFLCLSFRLLARHVPVKKDYWTPQMNLLLSSLNGAFHTRESRYLLFFLSTNFQNQCPSVKDKTADGSDGTLISPVSNEEDGIYWQQTSRHLLPTLQKSLRSGSFFVGLKVPLNRLMMILYLWVERYRIQAFARRSSWILVRFLASSLGFTDWSTKN